MLPDGDVSGMKEVVVKKEGNTTYIRRVRFKSEPAKGAVAAMEIKEAPETFEVPEVIKAVADPVEVVAADTGTCRAPQQITSQPTPPVSDQSYNIALASGIPIKERTSTSWRW